MIKPFAVLLVAAIALPLGASVPIPANLRNPFEVPDPVGFKTQNASAAKTKSAVETARETAFENVKEKLNGMPIRGIITNMKDASQGDVTILFGNYTIRNGSELPAADFGIKGIIQVTSVTVKQIVIRISIELENQEITIPLAH